MSSNFFFFKVTQIFSFSISDITNMCLYMVPQLTYKKSSHSVIVIQNCTSLFRSSFKF